MKLRLSLVESGANIALFGILALGGFLWASVAVRAVAFRYPLDYGEAHMIDQAMRLLDAESIYRPDISSPPYSIANYPPFMVVVLAPLLELFGPTFWWGRLLSALCTLSISLSVGGLVYRFTNDRFSSVVAGISFLSIPFVTFWSIFVRVDILALALSLAGLFVLSQCPLGKWRFACGILLLVAAAFTKQSYLLAAPLAAFCWLWQSSRKRAFVFLVLLTGIVLVSALFMNILTNGGFVFHVVRANIHEFTLERLLRLWEWVAEVGGIAICLGIIFAVYPLSASSWPLFGPYLLGAFMSSLAAGKEGSSFNYFVELGAALALASGQLLGLSRAQPRTWVRLGLLACLIIQGVLFINAINAHVIPYFERRFDTCGELMRLEELVSKAGGPILGDEYIGLATLQGRTLYIEPFIATQLARTGLWDQRVLLRDIEDCKFPLILLLDPISQERWTLEMIEAIQRSYRLDESVGHTLVFKPRR